MVEISTVESNPEVKIFWIEKGTINKSKLITCTFDKTDYSKTEMKGSDRTSKSQLESSHVYENNCGSTECIDESRSSFESNQINHETNKNESSSFEKFEITESSESFKRFDLSDSDELLASLPLSTMEKIDKLEKLQESEMAESCNSFKRFYQLDSDELLANLPLSTMEKIEKKEKSQESEMAESCNSFKRFYQLDSDELLANLPLSTMEKIEKKEKSQESEMAESCNSFKRFYQLDSDELLANLPLSTMEKIEKKEKSQESERAESWNSFKRFDLSDSDELLANLPLPAVEKIEKIYKLEKSQDSERAESWNSFKRFYRSDSDELMINQMFSSMKNSENLENSEKIEKFYLSESSGLSNRMNLADKYEPFSNHQQSSMENREKIEKVEKFDLSESSDLSKIMKCSDNNRLFLDHQLSSMEKSKIEKTEKIEKAEETEKIEKSQAMDSFHLSEKMNQSNTNELFLNQPLPAVEPSQKYHLQEEADMDFIWREVILNFDNPKSIIGTPCKILWPLDDKWYAGLIYDYNMITKKHQIIYKTFENEWLKLENERIKLKIYKNKNHPLVQSFVNDEKIKIKKEEDASPSIMKNKTSSIDHGCVVWGKVKGFSLWPAIVLNEEEIKQANLTRVENSIAVQFFGTYDFWQFKGGKSLYVYEKGVELAKKVKGKSKKLLQAIDEANRFILYDQLPENIIFSNNEDKINQTDELKEEEVDEEDEEEEVEDEEEEEEDEKDIICSDGNSVQIENHDNHLNRNQKRKNMKMKNSCMMNEEKKKKRKNNDVDSNVSFPLKLKNLIIHNIGNIVTDAKSFQNSEFIFPENFLSTRILPSFKEPNKLIKYQMKIIRNIKTNSPLFQIIPSDSEMAESESAAECWNFIAKNIFWAKKKLGQKFKMKNDFENSAIQFGFGHPKILPLIRKLEKEAKFKNKVLKNNFQNEIFPNDKFVKYDNKNNNYYNNFVYATSDIVLSNGSKPIIYSSQNNDLCDICFQNEEYEDNQMLQCDICGVMVHMHCYGVCDLPDGDLWLCSFCQITSFNKSKNSKNNKNAKSEKKSQICTLCPVLGGAMKQTTNGKFAHVVCSTWIPEVCLIKNSGTEVIDGVHKINKARLNLVCSLCHIKHGACIQCCYKSCCVAYHPLCARYAGLAMELEEVVDGIPKKKGALNLGDVQLLSYCKRHKNSKKDLSSSPKNDSANEKNNGVDIISSQNIFKNDPKTFEPPKNGSGCARSEAFNFAARRGLKAPEAVAAAELKRKYIQNIPYIISGVGQKGTFLPKNLTESMWALHWGKKKQKLDNNPPINVTKMSHESAKVTKVSQKSMKMTKTSHKSTRVAKNVPQKSFEPPIDDFWPEEENWLEMILEPDEFRNFFHPKRKIISKNDNMKQSVLFGSSGGMGQKDESEHLIVANKNKPLVRRKRSEDENEKSFLFANGVENVNEVTERMDDDALGLFSPNKMNRKHFDKSENRKEKDGRDGKDGRDEILDENNRDEIVNNVHEKMDGSDCINYYEGLLSISDRFRRMKSTQSLRLTFGKSAIHGWGVFTKVKHKSKDMIIEYVGEIIRPMIADLREKKIYDSVVGAGTYMFRIDNEKVVDATKTGSIAHLINHSCTPNCYSRIVFASGEEHIVIFAKRDIEVGEELTYDYRFFSRNERLSCNCGSEKCKGVVNIEEEEQNEDFVFAPSSEIKLMNL